MTPSNTSRPGWLAEKAPWDDRTLENKQAQKTAEGPAGLDLGDLLREQQFRKLNRIAGYLEKRSADVPEVAPVSKALNSALQKEAELAKTTGKGHAGAEWEQVKTAMEVASKTALDKSGDRAQKEASWKTFSAVSTIGALNRWAPEAGRSAEINPNLREMRQTMAARDNLSIVLHRGAGPTNRTMGGLVGQRDFRRADMPAENSPEAFDSAYRKMPPKVDRVHGVDGVESDVFLSRDGKVMLSHEGAVMEQLSTERKEHERSKAEGKIRDDSHIDTVDEGDLKKTQRTAAADSRFQSLSEFLESTKTPGRDYFEATQEAMRVEIEMKGKRHAAGAESRDEKVNADDDYKQTLVSQVGKDISQFNKAKDKAGDATPHEVVIFNGDEGDARKFDELRNFKTRMGTVYTGYGTSDLTPAKAKAKTQEKQQANLDRWKPHIDEIRTTVANVDAVPALKDFKVTLVSSGDRTEGRTGKTEKEELDFGKGSVPAPEAKRREKANEKWMAPETEVTRMTAAAEVAAAHPKVGLLIDDATKAGQYRGQPLLTKAPASDGLSHDRAPKPVVHEKT